MPRYDFLVIGSGLAGLSFAINAAGEGSVALVTKRGLEESNTAMAQGGIAVVWGDDDTLESHTRDTLKAGAGLCNAEVVTGVVEEAPARIRELIDSGVRFSANAMDREAYDLGLEGGHSHRRVLHAADQTGREIVRALIKRVRASPSIDVFENHHAVDLLIDQKFGLAQSSPQCWGAYVFDLESRCVHTFAARCTVLATGGAGKVYLYTSNPDVASGDGIAMAYRAGCRVADLEFIQFHPTCLYHPEAKSFLVTEAIRGEGAKLCTPDGEPFMSNYDPRGDLAPRDIVARAIDQEMKTSGLDNVILDLSELDEEFVRTRFPSIFERCRDFGIRLPTDPIPVVPAAHYMCGGVVTDVHGETAVGRLYAIGEVAMTGMHGANRLASNSLLEAVVFSHRAFEHSHKLLAGSPDTPPSFPDWRTGTAVDSSESIVISHNWDEIRRTMWNYVGIVRSDRRLERATTRIAMLNEEIGEYYWDFLITGDLLELRNIALVADLIIRSARSRRESRGLHYNLDCSEKDDEHWRRHTVI
ncbi:MAG: L-aspartate oxidase [Candidatus Binatia bacterium]